MTAVECKDVDNSAVIAGGVTTANLPQVARNFRRSAAPATSTSFSGLAIGIFLVSLKSPSASIIKLKN
jgi:hypothetical protein